MSKHKPLKSFKQDSPLRGTVSVPGDKSISHRALIFASLANGQSKITGLLEGEDVLRTAAALRQMGVEITKQENHFEVNGVGIAGLAESDDVLNMGNSGTAARLMAGLVAPYNFTSFFTGDDSLRKRPMKRIFEPLQKFGAKILAREDDLMPFAIIGAENPLPIDYKMKIASAQVKSSILLASLATRGITTIVEPEKCRDHTEIMMRHFGLEVVTEDFESSGKVGTKISYQGMQEFNAKNLSIPGDISSAAFLMVAALLVEGSKIKITNVGLNPLRDGIIKTLTDMGGRIEIAHQKIVAGEKVADIIVEHSKLKGITIPESRVPRMIDEYPILAIAAANAEGVTKMSGIEELKVKESNRFLMIAENLKKCGVEVKVGHDSLDIKGGIKQSKKIIKIPTEMDHRIAMSFFVMGMMMDYGVELDDSSMIATSFPGFTSTFSELSK